MIAKIGIIVFMVIVGVWFFYTNDQFLKEKESEKIVLEVNEIEEEIIVEEIDEAETVVKEKTNPTPVKSDGEKMGSVECMQRASEVAQGNIDEYRKALAKCQ
ncbi:hypothetical protein [Nitrosopumilus sp.]|uniref:hypothetical protein n=1 Tax=Nitrosopumilus sp. TaxID=2024843 RepID=UPI003D0FCD7F